METRSCHSLGFCTGKCPVELVESAAHKAQHSCKLLQVWDFRIFTFLSSLYISPVENGPVHIQNIPKKSDPEFSINLFLVYLVRKQEGKSLAFLAVSSISCPGNTVLRMELFSTSVWALYHVFLWNTYLVFCCVELCIRDPIPTFQNHLSSSTFLPTSSSPTEDWKLLTTVTPCNYKHRRRIPSQVMTYSLTPPAQRVEESKYARKKEKRKRRRKPRRGNIALCYISLATPFSINALRRKWKSVHSWQIEIPFASSTSPGSHFTRLGSTVHPEAAPTALHQGWISTSHEDL